MAIKKSTTGIDFRQDSPKLKPDHVIKDLNIDEIILDDENEYLFGYDEVDQLADSISDMGFKSVIQVYQTSDNKYICQSGHSRILASKKLGMTTIPCQIVKAPENENRKTIELIKQNTQREIKPLSKVRQIARLDEIYTSEGLSRGEIEEKLKAAFGMGKTQIHAYMSLGKLPEEIHHLYNMKGFPISDFNSIVKDLTKENLLKLADILAAKASENDDTLPTKDEIKKLAANLDSAPAEEPVKSPAKEYETIRIREKYKKLLKMKYTDEITVSKKNKAEIKKEAEELKEYLEKIIAACE